MTQAQFKKVGRLLKEVYAELDKEALLSKFPEEELIRAKDLARERVLANLGFTIEEYRLAKQEYLDSIKQPEVATKEDLNQVTTKVEEVSSRAIPTKEEIAQIAKEVLPPPQVTQTIVNKIVKETIIEKPQFIETQVIQREAYDPTQLKQELGNRMNSLEQSISNTNKFDIESVKKELTTTLDSRLKESINTLGMPDFRKLAMGLRQDIDALSATPASSNSARFADGETPSGTIDGANTGFTLAHAPSPAAALILFVNGQLLLSGGVDYTLSGTSITLVTAPPTNSTISAWYRY